MNWQTFTALFWRDLHVTRRTSFNTAIQTLFQPILFIFVFGYLMVGTGIVQSDYAQVLLPGTIAIVMSMTGIQSVAMPLLVEFQFTHDIEDRLLAPIRIEWIAVEKMIFGAALAIVSGLAVLVLGVPFFKMHLSFAFPGLLQFCLITALVAVLSSAGGLAIGCRIRPAQTGFIFPVIVGPMLMFGCAYYPWSSLAKFPVLQRLVLANPLVYASEGLRASLVPQSPHLPQFVVILVLSLVDLALVLIGLQSFRRAALS